MRAMRERGWRVGLPSELQWECAARAGQPRAIFPWGDALLVDAANCGASGLHDTTAVGCFAPNPWGLYDMAGNVWEWTCDAYRSSYQESAQTVVSAGPDTEVLRSVRGGSWIGSFDHARCAKRVQQSPDRRVWHLGFRLAVCSSTAA